MNRELVILGAGVAGLSAGTYAQRAGYSVTIYEMGDTPGGLCTSWRRKGFQFDGLVAGLAGTSAETAVGQLWKDLGVMDGCSLHYPENFGTIELPSGQRVVIHTNIDQLEQELLPRFDVDRKPIQKFLGALRACRWMEIPFSPARGADTKTRPWSLRALGGLPTVVGFGGMSLRRFLEGFRDPDCRLVFSNLVHFGGVDVPLLSILLPLAYAGRRMAGIPQDGWLSFARAIESEFVRQGGGIVYGKKAVGLLRAEEGVSGVVFEDTTEVAASRVLSAVDGRFTQTSLLESVGIGPPHLPQENQLSDQPVQVSLGLDLNPKEFSGAVTVVLPGVEWIAGAPQRSLTFHVNHYHNGAAPPGKASLVSFLSSDANFWRSLGRQSEYESEKRRCLDWVLDKIERSISDVRSRVEVTDVATPLTRERYTGNWKGAMQARRAGTGVLLALLSQKPQYQHSQLKGFYRAGQWVEPWGGITTAAISGRNAIRSLCRNDGIEFR